jgi:hypothetical protein
VKPIIFRGGWEWGGVEEGFDPSSVIRLLPPLL